MTPIEQANEFGISVTHTFVPLSKSRNKDKKPLTLNYLVTISLNGKPIIAGAEYSEGIGCYSKDMPVALKTRLTLSEKGTIDQACETGKLFREGSVLSFPKKTLTPDINGILASFFLDATAVNYDTFESWASELGYDTDSRRAEQTYNYCLSVGLKLRNALGSSRFEKMQEVCSQY